MYMSFIRQAHIDRRSRCVDFCDCLDMTGSPLLVCPKSFRGATRVGWGRAIINIWADHVLFSSLLTLNPFPFSGRILGLTKSIHLFPQYKSYLWVPRIESALWHRCTTLSSLLHAFYIFGADVVLLGALLSCGPIALSGYTRRFKIVK